MRIVTPLLTLALLVGALGLPLPGGPGAYAVGEPLRATGLGVDVVPGAAGILSPGGDLSITVTLSNRSSTTIPAGIASVYLDRRKVEDRADLAEWLDEGDSDPDAAAPDAAGPDADSTDAAGPDPDSPDGGTPRAESDNDAAGRSGDTVAQVTTPQLLAGESATLPTVVVPVASIGFDAANEFGAHKLAVSVTSAGQDLADAHSSVVADPGTNPPVSALALALPLAVPASSTGLIPADLLDVYTAADGLLSRQLDAAIASPRVAIGIDPRMIASIRILGDTAPESATAWLERLDSVTNETFALSYADTDIAATSQAGGGVLAPMGFEIDETLFPAESAGDTGQDEDAGSESPAPGGTPESSPSAEPAPSAMPTDESLLAWDYTMTGIAWPRDSTVVTPDLDAFAAAGLPTTILSSNNLSGNLSGNPSGDSSGDSESPVPGASATIAGHPVVTSDALVSRQLREAVRAADDAAWGSAMAKLSATLATLASEASNAGETGNPSETGSTGALNRAPHVQLATLDRNSPLDGIQLERTLAALDALPWTTPAGLSEAIAQSPVDATLVESPVATERIARLQSMFAAEGASAQFATVLTDPSLITDERRLSLLALASQSWTIDEVGWPVAVDDYVTRSGEITSSVQVVEGSTFQLFAVNGMLPIPVSNSLPYPVTVLVTVRPQTAILNVKESFVEVTVEADSQRRASVPVESIANGEVTVSISLSSSAGVPIAQPTFADINVQAGWETAATAVLFVVVVVIFALGILRTIRRRRRIGAGDEAEAEAPEQTDAAASDRRNTSE